MNHLKLKIYCSTTGLYLTDLILENLAYKKLAEFEDSKPKLDFELHDESGKAIDYED